MVDKRDCGEELRETLSRLDRQLSISIESGGAGAVDGSGVMARGSLWRVVDGLVWCWVAPNKTVSPSGIQPIQHLWIERPPSAYQGQDRPGTDSEQVNDTVQCMCGTPVHP